MITVSTEETEYYGFPHNTAPFGISAYVIVEDGKLTVVMGIDLHQLVANNVYYKWVDKHHANGEDPNELTWERYISLDWLRAENAKYEHSNSDETETTVEKIEEEEAVVKEENEAAQVDATGFVITEEEFECRSMFQMVSDAPFAEDDISNQITAAVVSAATSRGMIESQDRTMTGGSYPIRMDEDFQAAGEAIADILWTTEGFANGGTGDATGKCFAIYNVRKFENGYVVNYAWE